MPIRIAQAHISRGLSHMIHGWTFLSLRLQKPIA